MTELVFRSEPYSKSCTAKVVSADERGIRLDRTVFYAESGGQMGDTGFLRFADGRSIQIANTVKGASHDDVLHVPAAGAELPMAGIAVTAEIDWDRRHRLMRMHTCLHLLSSIIKGDVTGGQVSDGKGRLDFNLPDTALDKAHITAELN